MKMPSFTLRGFKRPSEVVDLAFGKLERGVMNIAWQQGEISVRDVHQAFEERIAYTTKQVCRARIQEIG